MGFKDDITRIFSEVWRQHGGNKAAAAEFLGVNAVTFWGWVQGKRVPNMEALAPVLDKLRAKITLPDDDPTREVVFVNPKIHESCQGLPRPIPDDYRAIPLTNMEVAAGPGLQTQEEPELLSWVLIYTQELAVRRSRLIAARVGKNQKSMLPSIQPGDIVVIDLDDKHIDRGGIFLVRDPDEGAALKRVKYFTKRGQPVITFYSDNAADGFEPTTYTLDEFDPDQAQAIDKAIVGRCIWQWGDLEKR